MGSYEVLTVHKTSTKNIEQTGKFILKQKSNTYPNVKEITYNL